MATAINISRLHFPVTTLGPGKRIGVWFQGCSIRCPGCISVDTWAHGRGETTVEAVVEAMAPWLGVAEGVTVSGGEPFEQPNALITFLKLLRQSVDLDILVYSGFPRESIEEHLKSASGLIDALISDPFEHTKPQTLPLRGSDNQRLHFLTPRGRERFESFNQPEKAPSRKFDLMCDEHGAVWLAGIPGRADFSRLRSMLEADGHSVTTSEDPAMFQGQGEKLG